ncbi:MAG: circularly permuted type 2 ATP-grasp protein [Rhodoferax sp.]|nr:circularly permuted type 2 ATP-grasp protein [Rhodoferax sp.]MCF8210553.1 circularly permuted type 2 ATP-grasp protein [Rhodoferax sp.]
MAEVWEHFFKQCATDGLGALDQRADNLDRQIRDNGVTYNVYADEGGPQRPWSLGLFPLIISEPSWRQIETGVLQRVRLLNRVMADVYGAQDLLALGLLPPALVQGHPGYLRAMHGVKPVGGSHLHIAAFDLARGPDGNWWVVSQRTQAPSGLGYLLENRLAVARLFPQAFESLQVQRLAGTYRALIDSMKNMSVAGQDAHIALLTPGPYNETYFEHAYLARYLGLTLVEGNDLIVRDQRLFLKTLRGLVRIDGLLKRLDDQFLDPLELRADSTLGIPGLLQVVRAGNVLMANAPGSAFLESPALLGFMPALAEHLLGEKLQMPALPTWWCGERSAMEQVLPRLSECTIKPTYPGSTIHGNFDAVVGRTLSQREIDEWAGRIALHADDHTIQAYMRLSQIPTWQRDDRGSGVSPRSVMLRVFAVSQGPQSWRILPGGLARVAGGSAEVASMQRGGSSADVWVITSGNVDKTTLLQPALTPSTLAQRKRLVTSRAAENLFWLGRYTERAENSVRLARLTLETLGGEDQSSQPLLTWLGRMAINNTLVLPGVPALTPVAHARRVFERSLIASLGNNSQATSVGFNLRAVRLAGASVRERLSQEHWSLMQRAEEAFFQSCNAHVASADYSSVQALATLKAASDHLAAITGLQTDRMTRDDGWRLLSIGRHIERLSFLSSALRNGFETSSVHYSGGFEAMVALFDSTITFHAQYQQSRDIAALIDLLVLDRDNPRSMAWVVQTLRGRLAKLAGSEPEQLGLLSLSIPDPAQWHLEWLCDASEDRAHDNLVNVLLDCGEAAYHVSEEIGAMYFTHSGQFGQSLGA